MATAIQQIEFINAIAPIIQAEAKERGYHVCSPIIAQACLESNYGLSVLSKYYYNYFGLKCGSYWKGKSVNMATKEEYNSQLVSIRDNFRVFDDMKSGVIGYFDFISTKRYANLKTATTPKQYLEYIKADGYATSSAYVTSNMNLISRLDLERFDDGETEIVVKEYSEPERLLKKGCTGDDVMWLQQKLVDKGYSLEVDGIFGAITEKYVLDFQKKYFVDGLVGTLTIDALKK